MQTGNNSIQSESGAHAPASLALPTRTTAAVMAEIPTRRGPYPKLKSWPRLAPAVAVHLNLGTHSHFRVPVKMMRKCGMHPERGVQVAVLVDRVIIWGDEHGGPYHQDAESKQFLLARAGVGPRVTQANFAIVEGPDYLVITTRNEALKMAGDAPVKENNRWEKMSSKSVAQRDDMLEAQSLPVLGWQDVNLFHTNCRTKTGIASVAGRLWWMAGMFAGDPIRFTRYKNATVIEKATTAEQHSVLCQTTSGMPRHYIGASLFDLHKTDRVRIIATPGRLIVTRAESDLGALCTGTPPIIQCAKQTKAPTYKPATPEHALAADGLEVLALRDFKQHSPSLALAGRIWSAAGFERMAPARMVAYSNAVVIEPCSEAEMDFRIGSPSMAHPYRTISLAPTVLARETHIRVLVTKGRMILTARNSDIGRKFRHVEQWPTVPAAVVAFMEKLRRGPEPEVPAVEVSSYPVPEGRRLQIQGKWLAEFGFKPGVQYDVAENKGEVLLRLAATGGATVTEHSPGRAKLYVPAQSLDTLNTDKVRVLGRQGELRLVPQAA